MGFNEAWEKVKAFIRMSEVEAKALWEEAKKTRGVVVEIGTLHGGSAHILSSGDAEVWTIDNNPKIEVEGRFHSIVGDSSTMPWEKPIDLLFIDGDHSFEGVLKDILTWLPRVKSGSNILFHDYDSHTGVTEAVDVFIGHGDLEIQNKYGSLLVTKKL